MKSVALASLILALGSLVTAQADDRARMGDLPIGSTVILPVDATVAAFTDNTGFMADVGDEATLNCELSFASATVDRSLKGQVRFQIAKRVEFSGNMNHSYILSDGTLDGTNVKGFRLWCYQMDLSAADDVSIGQFRTLLTHFGGTLTEPAVVPFGQTE